MMESMNPEPLNGTAEGDVKPPRPPPAKNDSPSKPSVSHINALLYSKPNEPMHLGYIKMDHFAFSWSMVHEGR